MTSTEDQLPPYEGDQLPPAEEVYLRPYDPARPYGYSIPIHDRMDGTYRHPSPSMTAEHCINFWGTIAIPDEIVLQANSAYYRARQSEIEDDIVEIMRLWTIRWLEKNPEPPKKGRPHAIKAAEDAHSAQWRKEHEVHRLKELPKVQAKRPERLMIYENVQLVRVAQMYSRAPREADQHEEVMNYPIEMRNGQSTVREIYKSHRLDWIVDAIKSVDEPDSPPDISSEVEEIRDFLREWKFEREEERIKALQRANNY